MAKLISPVWSIIRGSIAGTTYLSGSGNTIIARQKTAPTNPQTESQSVIRGGYVEASALWKEVITKDDHDKWDLYAATLSLPGPLGNYNITGQQAFMMAYTSAKWFENNGGNVVPGIDPPLVSGLLDVGDYNFVDRINMGTGVQLNAVNYSGDDASIQVQISGPWKESKRFYKGPWDNANIQFFDLDASTSSSFDVDTPEDNAYYFFRVKAITRAVPLRTQRAQIYRHLSSTV